MANGKARAPKKKAGSGKKKRRAAEQRTEPLIKIPPTPPPPPCVPCRVRHVGWVFCDAVLLVPVGASVYRLQIEICEKIHRGSVLPDEVVVLRRRLRPFDSPAAAGKRAARPATHHTQQGAPGGANSNRSVDGTRAQEVVQQAVNPVDAEQPGEPPVSGAESQAISKPPTAKSSKAAAAERNAGGGAATLEDIDDTLRTGANPATVLQACAEPISSSFEEFYGADPSIVRSLVEAVALREKRQRQSRDERWGVFLYGSARDYEYHSERIARKRDAELAEVKKKSKPKAEKAGDTGPVENGNAAVEPHSTNEKKGTEIECEKSQAVGLQPDSRPSTVSEKCSLTVAQLPADNVYLEVYYDVQYTATSTTYLSTTAEPLASPVKRSAVNRASPLITFETPTLRGSERSASPSSSGARRPGSGSHRNFPIQGGWVAGM